MQSDETGNGMMEVHLKQYSHQPATEDFQLWHHSWTATPHSVHLCSDGGGSSIQNVLHPLNSHTAPGGMVAKLSIVLV